MVLFPSYCSLIRWPFYPRSRFFIIVLFSPFDLSTAADLSLFRRRNWRRSNRPSSFLHAYKQHWQEPRLPWFVSQLTHTHTRHVVIQQAPCIVCLYTGCIDSLPAPLLRFTDHLPVIWNPFRLRESFIERNIALCKTVSFLFSQFLFNRINYFIV